MRIAILAVNSSSEKKPSVHFSTDLGDAWAYWSGTPPTPRQTLDVELSAGSPLTWGKDIRPAPSESPRLESNDGGVIIHATLESREDDGFTVLRLGSGILMLETNGDAPPTGTIVRADLQKLTLSNTNI
jgi:hypothetical protein